MWKNKKKQIEIQDQINVTPLIDIMLVLLIIFMITSQNIIEGVHVNLPKISNSDKLQETDTQAIKISIDEHNDIYINSIKTESVKDDIKKVVKGNPNARVLIYGDNKVNYGRILEIFSVIKGSGVHHISLATSLL